MKMENIQIARLQNPPAGAVLHPGERIRVQFVRVLLGLEFLHDFAFAIAIFFSPQSIVNLRQRNVCLNELWELLD